MKIKLLAKSSSIQIFIFFLFLRFLSFLPITRISKNRVFIENKDIWLNGFKKGAFCYLFWMKGTNAYFGHPCRSDLSLSYVWVDYQSTNIFPLIK